MKNAPLVATVAGLHVLAYRDMPRYSVRVVVAPTNTANITREGERAIHEITDYDVAAVHACAIRVAMARS